MRLWPKFGGDDRKALKESEMRFPGRSMVWFDFPRPDHSEMATEVGDGTTSDIVMTPVRWLQRAFNESRIEVLRNKEPVEEHVLPTLIENPNRFYAAEHLYAGTVFSLSTDGNAYWIKVRNGFSDVKELWYVPHLFMEPKWPDDGSVFISHYEYRVAGRRIRLEIEDVVHFRDGVDPQNLRKGLSPLKGLLREVWTDNEAAIFTASLLKNGGVPGVVIAPKGEGSIEPQQADQVKEKFKAEFGRERRGNAMVMHGPTEVHQFGFNPQELDMSAVRNISEERVTAALGVPAAVVGFGAGLQQTKVGATMRELRRLAWDNGVIPLQQIVAGAIERQLLPDIGADKEKVGYDNSEVSALQEDEKERDERVANLVKSGIWTRGEGRAATGQEATPADEVFLIPFSMVTVPRNGRPEPRPAPAPMPTDPEERALRGIEAKQHSHTLLEEQVAREARRATPPAQAEKFAQSIDAIRRTLPPVMETELLGLFDDLGAEVEQVANRILVEERAAANGEMKRESLLAGRIVEGLEMLGFEKALQQIFEQHYFRVGAEAGAELAKFLSVGVGLPDPVARALVATGGRRAGLLDLTAKTKRKIFERLTEGRIAGLAGDNLARFIREGVEAGPWSSAAVRARVIARTETAFATNVSVVEGARSITGVEMMMIHDGRAGDTDETCEALNGRVVTIDEAQQLAADEHPNGTRSFTPLTPQLIEEMGL